MGVNKKIKRALSNMSLKTLFKKRSESRMSGKTTEKSYDFADKTPKIDEKWRKQVDRMCNCYDSYRISTSSSTIGEMYAQSALYRRELDDMRREIAKLKVEKNRLSRALQSDSPRGKFTQSKSFIRYQAETQVDLTPNRLRQSSRSSRQGSLKSTSRSRSAYAKNSYRESGYRDSAYISREATPEKPNTNYKYLSNGRNSFYLFV